MTSVFLVAFVGGLVLNVVLVIRGTERWTGTDLARRLDAVGRELRLGRISLRTPVAASLFSAFGLTGYLLRRYTQWPLPITVAFAALGAGLAVASSVLIVRRWAASQANADVTDERYVLQGQLATVVEGSGHSSRARVEYQIDARRFVVAAESLDGEPLAIGNDVVIDRFEDGVAFVEDWSRVEQRL